MHESSLFISKPGFGTHASVPSSPAVRLSFARELWEREVWNLGAMKDPFLDRQTGRWDFNLPRGFGKVSPPERKIRSLTTFKESPAINRRLVERRSTASRKRERKRDYCLAVCDLLLDSIDWFPLSRFFFLNFREPVRNPTTYTLPHDLLPNMTVN